MNPSAVEFHPKGSRAPPGSTPLKSQAPAPAAVPAPSKAVAAPPPQPVAKGPSKSVPYKAVAPVGDGLPIPEQSSLRADAKSFQPRNYAAAAAAAQPSYHGAGAHNAHHPPRGSMPPPPPPPPPPPAAPIKPPPSYAQHVDPFTVAERSKLSPEAAPYTPTKQTSGGNTPKFPSTPSGKTAPEVSGEKAQFPVGPAATSPTVPEKAAPAENQSEPNGTPTSAAPPALGDTAKTSPLDTKGDKSDRKSVSTPTSTGTPSSPHLQPGAAGSASKPLFSDSKLPVPATAQPVPAHPPELNTSWTLYADDHAIVLGGDAKTYRDPVLIGSVKDVEGFWKLWRHVPQVSTRTPSFTYFWFRKEIKPNWEDSRNKNGGTLNVCLYDRDRLGLNDRAPIDDVFLLTVLAVTGESLAESSGVNGVVLKLRQKSVVLQLWTNHTTKGNLSTLADAVRSLLEPYAAKASLEKGKMEFLTHQQVQSAVSSKPVKKGGKPAPKAATREPDYLL